MLARPARFERAALCSGGIRSIQVSYGRLSYYDSIFGGIIQPQKLNAQYAQRFAYILYTGIIQAVYLGKGVAIGDDYVGEAKPGALLYALVQPVYGADFACKRKLPKNGGTGRKGDVCACTCYTHGYGKVARTLVKTYAAYYVSVNVLVVEPQASLLFQH